MNKYDKLDAIDRILSVVDDAGAALKDMETLCSAHEDCRRLAIELSVMLGQMACFESKVLDIREEVLE